MAESVYEGNDVLHQLPGLPIRAGRPPAEAGVDYPAHIIDNSSESSPLATPGPTAHIGADPADAAKGAIA